MADKHPYTSGGSGGIVQAISQLRKSFPSKVTAETLKKLGIAPNNESYIISILRFVNIIDSDGQKTKEATTVFSQHEDVAFQQGLSVLIEKAYGGLFQLHGKGAWSLPSAKLITYFRNSDHTSAVVGKRQAHAFQALASLSGHGDAPLVPKPTGTKTRPGERKKTKVPGGKSTAAITPPAPAATSSINETSTLGKNGVGLTVRIEINLPAAGDQDTYDRIFKSIRENLLSAK